MKSNYRKIGDFIELIDERNKDLEISLLLGLSVTKVFIPSVANIIGTNMKNYKIIRKGQFACSVMQVRRDKKMPVALLLDFDEAIISQAYPVFQIKDETQLLPEYLMMWFTRSEFDREACFLAVGGVRGSLEWEDFLNMELPIPTIKKQQEIVKEYNIVVNRIQLNETLNQKLEETAQALYKHWFVDFEFPNAKGKPYKSSGGKMVYNEELDGEIPLGWSIEKLNNLVSSQYGFTASADFEKRGVKFLRITDISSDYIHWNAVPYCEIDTQNLKKYKLHKGDIIIARTGASVGSAKQINNTKTDAVFASYLVRLKPKYDDLFMFLGVLLTSDIYKNYILNVAGGSAQPQANAILMTNYTLVLPKEILLKEFNKLIQPIINKKELLENEILELNKIRDLLLSKMTKLEA
jgi:type I restriction enzyme S subunit